MGKTKKNLTLLILLILLPVGIFQNCADSMLPQHDLDGEFNLSSLNPEGFKVTLQPVIRTNCAACHGVSQEPRFAVADESESIQTLIGNGMVDLDNPANSQIVAKIAAGHSGLPTTLSADLQAQIAAWAAGVTAGP